MASYKYVHDYDNEKGFAKCIIIDKKGNQFVGTAQCHPDDVDMKSSFTGQTIAEYRANREALRYMRDCEIIPELHALKELYGTMKHSTRFNPKSYENVMLQRLIRQKENELVEIRCLIAAQTKQIKEFIMSKEKCYQGVRRHRAEAAHEQGQN